MTIRSNNSSFLHLIVLTKTFFSLKGLKTCQCGNHHEDHSAEPVICGKHVVYGRHVLPRMSTCSQLGNAPESIMKLLTQDSLTTEEPYLKHIHSFNSVFFFTSMGASIDPELANGTHGIYTYCLQGAVYYRIGSLFPDENCIP
ncbi:408_t:CDS:2, partial [Gigaspora rosea]